MFQDRPSVRAMREDVSLGHAGEQSVNLPMVQLISGLDRRLTGHGGQDVIDDKTPAFLVIIIGETGQKLTKQLAGTRVTHHRRNCRDDIRIAAEFPDAKTHLLDLVAILLHTFGLGQRKFNRFREKQGLAGNTPLRVLVLQLFKEEAFVGGMLIDDQQAAVGRLAEDIEIGKLPDNFEAVIMVFDFRVGLWLRLMAQ